MTAKPVSHPGGWISLGLSAAGFVLAFWLVSLLPTQQISAATFWLAMVALLGLGVGLYFLYYALALFWLVYLLDRNGLRIRWGATTRQIPITAITEISPADPATLPARRLLGVALPPWWAGSWNNWRFFSTNLQQSCLIVKTADCDFVISPADPAAFLRGWRLRLPLGPTQTWSQPVIRKPFFDLPLWFDPLAWWLVGGAVLANLILVGAVMTAYPGWPAAVRVNLNPLGQTNTMVPREQLLWLPAIGAGLLLLNLLLGGGWHHRDRLAAYLIWFVAILVQLGLWVAVRMVLR